MLYISEDDVKRVLTMSDAVSLVERGLVDRARRRAVDVPRDRMRIPQGALNILQGAATRHLARGNAAVVGQIGAGRIGAGQLDAVCAVRPVRGARVYARTRDKLKGFCRTI